MLGWFLSSGWFSDSGWLSACNGLRRRGRATKGATSVASPGRTDNIAYEVTMGWGDACWDKAAAESVNLSEAPLSGFY